KVLEREFGAVRGKFARYMGDHAGAGEPIQDGALPAHAGHRVALGPVQTRLRPGLLENKPLLPPVTDVDTAAGGEMEGLTNFVGHVGGGGPVPGVEVGL